MTIASLFGVALCNCDEEERDEELINDLVFDANCKGVIRLKRAIANDN